MFFNYINKIINFVVPYLSDILPTFVKTSDLLKESKNALVDNGNKPQEHTSISHSDAFLKEQATHNNENIIALAESIIGENQTKAAEEMTLDKTPEEAGKNEETLFTEENKDISELYTESNILDAEIKEEIDKVEGNLATDSESNNDELHNILEEDLSKKYLDTDISSDEDEVSTKDATDIVNEIPSDDNPTEEELPEINSENENNEIIADNIYNSASPNLGGECINESCEV